MTPLPMLDLFSGIGGFSLGLERSSLARTVAFCEIDKFCQKVLKKHWPEVPQYDDIRELTSARLELDGIERPKIICGGFPCQDISVAGRGAGLAGERSGLWREYARLIGELRPDFVFVENVAALLGRGLGEVLGDLAALGYDAEWDCIRASDVGAPHKRERVWIVAHPQRTRWEGLVTRDWLLGSKGQTHAKHGNRITWGCGSVVPGGRRGGNGNGVSLAMERRRLHASGNAVVPQIPELLGQAVIRSMM